MATRNIKVPVAFAITLAASALGCVDPDQFLPAGQAGEPAGVLEGTATYAGPLPCTENGHVLGAGLMLVFDTRLLPPPEGLGTTAASLAVIPGEDLFGGVRTRLTFNDDKSRWCPDPAKDDPVTVSGDWIAAPLPAATYQVRAFYDLDGNFDPVFSIANLPTKGDIGGGAIDNPAEVLQGKPPRYREIALGAVSDPDAGTREIPEEGARISGIAVTLGLPLPLDRPIFYPKAVIDESGKNKDPLHVKMPSDYLLPVFTASEPGETEKSLIRITYGPGVAPKEADVASKPPFGLPTKTPQPFYFKWQDANRDGMLDLSGDHIPDSALIPSIFPFSVFAKLVDPKGVAAQASPAVIIQGLTIYNKSLVFTALTQPTLNDQKDELVIGVRPAALCLDPTDQSKPGVLVVTHEKDSMGNIILTDAPNTLLALKKQFNRKIDLVYGCLPQGTYSANLVYDTGQAWSVPNEAGVCSPLESDKVAGMCGERAKLASQAGVLEITAPDKPDYCEKNPTPAACLPPK